MRAFQILPIGGGLFLGKCWYDSLGICSLIEYPQRKTSWFFPILGLELRLVEDSQGTGLLSDDIPARRDGVKIRTEDQNERSVNRRRHTGRPGAFGRTFAGSIRTLPGRTLPGGAFAFRSRPSNSRRSPNATRSSARAGQHRRLPVRATPLPAGPGFFPGGAPRGRGGQRPQRRGRFRRQHRIPLHGAGRTGCGRRVDSRHD